MLLEDELLFVLLVLFVGLEDLDGALFTCGVDLLEDGCILDCVDLVGALFTAGD